MTSARRYAHQARPGGVALPRRRRGFTLIELIVVVVILAILAAIGAFAYRQVTESSRAHSSRMAAEQVARDAAGLSANAQTAVANLSPDDLAGLTGDLPGDVTVEWDPTPAADGTIGAGVNRGRYCTPVTFPSTPGHRGTLGATVVADHCNPGSTSGGGGAVASNRPLFQTYNNPSDGVGAGALIGDGGTDVSGGSGYWVGDALRDANSATGVGPFTWNADPGYTSSFTFTMFPSSYDPTDPAAPADAVDAGFAKIGYYTPANTSKVTLKMRFPAGMPTPTHFTLGVMAHTSGGNVSVPVSNGAGWASGTPDAQGWLTIDVPWDPANTVYQVQMQLQFDATVAGSIKVSEFEVQ